MVTAPPQRPGPPTGAREPWWRRTWTLPSTLFTLVFLSTAVPPYLSLDPSAAPVPIRPGPAWYYPLLVTHVFGGTLLMLITVAQLSPAAGNGCCAGPFCSTPSHWPGSPCP